MLLGLTLANAALLLVLLMQHMQPARADGSAPILRGRALEIVDVQGRVRASSNGLPAGRSPNGEAYAQTVLMRLNTERG